MPENTRATVTDHLFFDLDTPSNRRIKRSARSSQKARAQIEAKHRRDENARLLRFFEEHTARQKTQATKKKRARAKKKAAHRLTHVEEVRRVEQARLVETATVIAERQRLKREEQEKKRRQMNRELIEQEKT